MSGCRRRRRHLDFWWLGPMILSLVGCTCNDDSGIAVSQGRWRGPDPGAEGPPDPHATLPSFIVVEDLVRDTTTKGEIEMHIVVPLIFEEEAARALLRQLHDDAVSRTRFEHRVAADSVFIFLYGTEAEAKLGGGNWFAKLVRLGRGQEPVVQIDLPKLQRVGVVEHRPEERKGAKKPKRRFGLTETQRKEVFYELLLLEDKAWRKANGRYPDPHLHYTGTALLEVEEMRGNYAERLILKVRRKIARRHKLTVKQLEALAFEGVRNRWAMPPD